MNLKLQCDNLKVAILGFLLFEYSKGVQCDNLKVAILGFLLFEYSKGDRQKEISMVACVFECCIKVHILIYFVALDVALNITIERRNPYKIKH